MSLLIAFISQKRYMQVINSPVIMKRKWLTELLNGILVATLNPRCNFSVHNKRSVYIQLFIDYAYILLKLITYISTFYILLTSREFMSEKLK